MVFSFLAIIFGFLVGFVLLLVIFSLLNMAQRGDLYLENFPGMASEEGRWEDHPTEVKEVPLKPLDEEVERQRLASRPSE